ncbi:MAG TPA: hypothetical protein PLE79_06205 [Clostridia bacterium]|nr:hypothetical protein [Clostridia bacterium]
MFNVLYITFALIFSFMLLFGKMQSPARMLAGAMALVLVGGDAFHLLPRILAAYSAESEKYRNMLGRGKQITSITMTVFYLLLFYIGVLSFLPQGIRGWTIIVYVLAAVRIILCLLPQNKWLLQYPPVKWGVIRNIPFVLQGAIVAGLFFINKGAVQGLALMWLAICLSFLFYLPVVLWANKYAKIGMLMLPKSCAYLWMLAMCLSL